MSHQQPITLPTEELVKLYFLNVLSFHAMGLTTFSFITSECVE